MAIQLDQDADRPRRPVLPPAEAVDCQPIRTAIETWETAKQATRIAQQTLEELERTREIAVAEDRDRYATAIEKGRKGDPGTFSADAHDEKTRAAQRHADARQVVQDWAFAAMKKDIANHEEEWAEQVAARLSSARQKWLAAVDALAACQAELGQATALAGYLRNGERRFHSEAGQVPFRRSHDEKTVPVEALLDALRTLGCERPPAPAPRNVNMRIAS